MKTIKEEAYARAKWIKDVRRRIHRFAECGFDLPKTRNFVKEALQKIGYDPKPCGKCGVICQTAGVEGFPVILLRADMDALPIREQTALPFRAENGNMHACGHDMHTAMLLGAAAILKEREGTLPHPVRFAFQAAEETLAGAKDLCDHGVLSGVSASLMLHTLPATDLATGTVLVPHGGIGAPAARFFSLRIIGECAHVGDSSRGRDALAQAFSLYHELCALRDAQGTGFSLAIGRFLAGDAPNIVPAHATLEGTFRSYRAEDIPHAEAALTEICQRAARASGCHVEIRFTGTCPPLVNDERLSSLVTHCLKDTDIPYLHPKPSGGAASEDFAIIAQKTPSLALAIAAGRRGYGYEYPLHHPQALFDEAVLPIGATVLAASALAMTHDPLLQTFTM